MNCIRVSVDLSRQFATMSFVCAILIVTLHSFSASGSCAALQWIRTLVVKGLCSTAIPWFFFAAGFFLAGHVGEDGWWKREVLKRVRTLPVPFWIWGSIIFVFHVIFAFGIHHLGYSFGGDDALTWLSWKGIGRITGLYPFGDIPTMWFMRTLFVFVVLSPLIVKMRLWGVVLFGMLYVVHAFTPSLNWMLRDLGGCLLSFRGLTYFAAGLYVRRNPIHIDRHWIFWSVSVCLLFARASYPVGLIGKSLEIMLIPFALVTVFDCCRYIKLPQELMALSFPIYLVHMMIVFCISAFYGFTGIAHSYNTGFSLGLLKTVSAIAISIVFIRMVQQFSPRFAMVAFGGRGM